MKRNDWLIAPKGGFTAKFLDENGFFKLTNGIVERTFLKTPSVATVSLCNLYSGEEFLRSIKPEITLTIDGEKFNVGGVYGIREHAFFLYDWLSSPTENIYAGKDFKFDGYTLSTPQSNVVWNRKFTESDAKYPADGVRVEFDYSGCREETLGISVTVIYELYNDAPVMSKSFCVKNTSGKDITLNKFDNEILALCDYEDTSLAPYMKNGELPMNLAPMRNFFASSDIENTSTPTCNYHLDEEYTSQVNYSCQYPSLFISRPPVGPGAVIKNECSFTSYKTYIMPLDDADMNRRSIAIARFYEVVAPWCVKTNPLYLHVVSSNFDTIAKAVDQCAECGFEMIILSFGSGLNMESVSEENIAKYKKIADYAHSKNIYIGGYSLLASRRINDESDVISDNIIFGNSPCLGSEWGIKYLQNIKTFLKETGFDNLEHDGSYPGDTCASEKHPGHKNYEDSQYTQLMQISELYRWCLENGIYLTVPDFYFMSGNTKVCMGYKEVNWSLPRAEQQVIARQNIHDGTQKKHPAMGWMFVPLTEYHGGGAAATIEPLCEHIDHYRIMLLNNMLAGVQAAYRGIRLYDTEETKSMVLECTNLYKKYRKILETPMVRLGRPTSRDIDGYIHVDPQAEEIKGFVALFNPTSKEITKTITLPLYYTGLKGSVEISLFDKKPEKVYLDESYETEITVKIPAGEVAWYTVRPN